MRTEQRVFCLEAIEHNSAIVVLTYLKVTSGYFKVN